MEQTDNYRKPQPIKMPSCGAQSQLRQLLHLRLREHGRKTASARRDRVCCERESLRNVRIHTHTAHQHGCQKQDQNKNNNNRQANLDGERVRRPPPHTENCRQLRMPGVGKILTNWLSNTCIQVTQLFCI